MQTIEAFLRLFRNPLPLSCEKHLLLFQFFYVTSLCIDTVRRLSCVQMLEHLLRHYATVPAPQFDRMCATTVVPLCLLRMHDICQVLGVGVGATTECDDDSTGLCPN